VRGRRRTLERPDCRRLLAQLPPADGAVPAQVEKAQLYFRALQVASEATWYRLPAAIGKAKPGAAPYQGLELVMIGDDDRRVIERFLPTASAPARASAVQVARRRAESRRPRPPGPFICRGITEHHGGTISFESEVGAETIASLSAASRWREQTLRHSTRAQSRPSLLARYSARSADRNRSSAVA
jgi:hypothetical protein